ncbi:MAG TPA: hypothetical protein VM659_22820, partial [Dongiaceae bacterium]|nr:hypothetical protein [Dongiaceae bacterium]
MWHHTRLTPRQIKIRQRRAIAAVETILRGELPNALGMSAQATSMYLVDEGNPTGRPAHKDMEQPIRDPGSVRDIAPVKGSSFHLATIYQHQLCGESSGYLMPLSQGIMLRDVRIPPGSHPRGEW